MYYFLAHFPKIDFTQINEIRSKYDPNKSYIDPHIAVVFPVDSTFGESNLIDHIQSITNSASSFSISLSGLEKSWDHYLYLTVSNGVEMIITLHDKLYSGVLEKYWFKDGVADSDLVAFSVYLTYIDNEITLKNYLSQKF